jgi:hypothetical protein
MVVSRNGRKEEAVAQLKRAAECFIRGDVPAVIQYYADIKIY